MSPLEHPEPAAFLRAPEEIRAAIYHAIAQDIEHEELDWQQNRITSYEGLRYACKQIYIETAQQIFYKYITRKQPLTKPRFLRNRSMFRDFRSLQVEFDFGFDDTIWRNFAIVLDRFQLSFQDVGISFVGTDAQENTVRSAGCALLDANNCEALEVLDQEVEVKLPILRQLALLRNVKVLRIENLNMPIFAAVFMHNKKYLEALSVRNDPRSILHSFEAWPRSKRRSMIQNFSTPIKQQFVPPIRALEIDLNSTLQAADIVGCLVRTLEHLSWRVPSNHFQMSSTSTTFKFGDADTFRMMDLLPRRAPHLSTLRLCLQPEDTASQSRSWNFSEMTTAFQQVLPQLNTLESLEIHWPIASSEFNFFSGGLFKCFPPSLRRLYITDNVMTVREIFSQAWQYGFGTILSRVLDSECYDGTDSEANLSENTVHKFILISQNSSMPYSHHNVASESTGAPNTTTSPMVVRYLSDCIDTNYRHGHLIGADKRRPDYMNCRDNNLTFVTFEFDSFDYVEYAGGDQATDATLLLTLNGRLLDKQLNRHLWTSENNPVSNDYNATGWIGSQDQQALETAEHSLHPSINIKLFEALEMKQSASFEAACIRELSECKAMQSDKWDWYFGEEADAMATFDMESVANIDDVQLKSGVALVDVDPAARCRWMCPNARVGSIADFPRPPVPSDWRD